MLNEVRLIGRLGADPEIKNLQSGKQVANMRIATTEKWRDKNSGERKEKTEWTTVVCWNENLNGIIEQYVRKGSLVMVTGKLQTREWEKNGEKRYATEVVMQGYDCKLLMLGGKDDNGGGRSRRDDDDGFGGSDHAPSRSRSSGSAPRRNSDMDDDIPFSPEFR